VIRLPEQHPKNSLLKGMLMNENAVLESAAELSVIMVPAPNDPPKPSKEYQADLGVFTHGMRAEGIEYRSRDYLVEDTSGGFKLGEFLVVAKTIAPVFTGLVGAWLHAKYGRKVKLKYKDLEVEATTVEEVERLVKPILKREKKK
jgi:hypothetical protein